MSLRKLIGTVVLSTVSVITHAEFISNPDANTLWIENGKDIKTGKSMTSSGIWFDTLKIAPLPNGGFVLGANLVDKAKCATGLDVPISPLYPYLVFEMTKITSLNTGYKGVSLFSFTGGAYFPMIDNLESGLVVYNIYSNAPEDFKMKESCHLRTDISGVDIDFAYVKMVKEPDYYIKIESPAIKANKALKRGDIVKFTVKMKEAAEDISLRFHASYGMHRVSINSQDGLQLKPEDESGKVWSTETTITSLGYQKDQDFPINGVLVKAIILGGGIQVPLWTPLQFPYTAGK